MTSSGKIFCWKRYKRDALRIEMGLKGYIIEEREMGLNMFLLSLLIYILYEVFD